MNQIHIWLNEFKQSENRLPILSLALFLNSEFILAFLSNGLRLLHFEVLQYPALFIILYTPLLVHFYRTRKFECIDFFVMLSSIALYFFLSYILHPENAFFFTRPIYGALTRVFRPDRALYIYLFIRAVHNPKDIFLSFKLACLLLTIYYTYRFAEAQLSGGWADYNSVGTQTLYPYSLSYGYQVVFLTFTFFYAGYLEKSVACYMLSFYTLLLVLFGGSRGALLVIGIFLMLFLITHIKKETVDHFLHKKYIIPGVAVMICAVLLYKKILYLFYTILSFFGISSRTLLMLAEGSFTDANGRTLIWNKALELIFDGNILGHGAYGDRAAIYPYHFAGYSHNVFLEIFVTFGILIGSFLILLFLYRSYQLLFKGSDEYWKTIFIICLSTSCQLLLSMSFWYVSSFWAAIAILVCFRKDHQILKAAKGGISWKRRFQRKMQR